MYKDIKRLIFKDQLHSLVKEKNNEICRLLKQANEIIDNKPLKDLSIDSTVFGEMISCVCNLTDHNFRHHNLIKSSKHQRDVEKRRAEKNRIDDAEKTEIQERCKIDDRIKKIYN